MPQKKRNRREKNNKMGDSGTTTIKKRHLDDPSSVSSKVLDAVQSIKYEFKDVRSDIGRLTEKVTEIIIKQNGSDHKFDAISARIAPIERGFYGVISLIVVAVISALIYTVVTKP